MTAPPMITSLVHDLQRLVGLIPRAIPMEATTPTDRSDMTTYLISHTSPGGNDCAQATVTAASEGAARAAFHARYPGRQIGIIGTRGAS